MMKNTKGFTLIELMIVIIIVGILGAIAYPSYQDSVRKSRRTEAKTALLDIMAKQEQYFSEERTYADTFAKLGVAGTTSIFSKNNYYGLHISPPTPGAVTVYASAINSQAVDEVRSYWISSNGQKTWKAADGLDQAGWE